MRPSAGETKAIVRPSGDHSARQPRAPTARGAPQRPRPSRRTTSTSLVVMLKSASAAPSGDQLAIVSWSADRVSCRAGPPSIARRKMLRDPDWNEWYASSRPSGEIVPRNSSAGPRVSRSTSPPSTATRCTSELPPRSES